MPQQQKQKSKPALGLLKSSPTIIKVIIIILLVYIIYSVITSIFVAVSKPLKAISNLLGLGGLDPNATKSPWWVWIGIAWYCGFFGLAKAGMSKLTKTISFHENKTIKEIAKEYNISEESLDAFSKEAGNESLTPRELAFKYQTEKIYKPYIEKLKQELDAATKAHDTQRAETVQHNIDEAEQSQEEDQQDMGGEGEQHGSD
jgi:hypothetical protein